MVVLDSLSRPHSLDERSHSVDLHDLFRGLMGNVLAVVSATLIPAALQLRMVCDLKCAGPYLLLGDRFSGKSTIMLKIAEVFGYNSLTVSRVEWIKCRDLVGLPLKSVMESFQTTFNRVINQAPCLLLIDDIDILCLNPDSSEALQRQECTLFTRYFCNMFDKITEQNTRVLRSINRSKYDSSREFLLTQCMYDSLKLVAVIVSAQSLSSLPVSLTQKCVTNFTIPPISPKQYEALHHMLSRYGVRISHVSQNQRDSIQVLLDGYVIGDISHLARTISSKFSARDSASIGYEDILEYVSLYKPLSLSTMVSVTPSDRSWKEICGLQRAKQKIADIFTRPVIFKKIFSLVPIRISRAILLYGPPGSGELLSP